MRTKSSLNQRVFGTFATSGVVMIIQFLILLCRARNFDDVQQGYTALFILNIDLIAHLSMVIGGTALVYLASRHALHKLLIPAYTWAVIASAIGFGILYGIDQVHPKYSFLVLLAGLLQALFTINHQILLGKNDIRWFNGLQVFQYLTVFGCLVYLVFDGLAEYTDFLFSYLIAIGLSFIISIIGISRYRHTVQSASPALPDMVKLGVTSIIGAFAQRINSRFSIYVLNSSFVMGTAMVGLFSTGQSIIEKLMIVSKSFSSVQYAEISSNRDPENAINRTLSFLKLTLYITLLGALCAILIPESVYLHILGEQWVGIKNIIFYLVPAVIMLSVSNIFSHYFSGLGRYKVNSIASILGLIVTLSLAFILIPSFGINGCILTISASYFCMTFYQISIFYKTHQFVFSDWILQKEDIIKLKRALRKKV